MDVDEGMPDMAGSAPHNQDTGRMPSPGEWMSSALVDESSPPLSTLSETSHPSQEHQPESLDLQTDISYSHSSRHGPVDADRYETSPDLDEAKSKTISYIERWEDLSCIRFLNHVHKKGGVDNRGYQILYRMCQLIWAIGHEVEIRKKVKLPRAQRLAKLQSYCEALVQGAKLWQKNMKAHVYHVLDVIFSLPRLRSGDAFQNLEPKLNEWYEAMSELYRPGLDDTALFSRILKHYGKNYAVLYALHREKPDYGLRDVLPSADKVYKLFMKLPGYALAADELILEMELYFWRKVDCCHKDRQRQEQAVVEFDAMSDEDKASGFEEYLRHFHQDFIQQVNTAPRTIPQDIFNERLHDLRTDFLWKIADIIKHDDYHVDEHDEENVELQRLFQQAQEHRDAERIKTGWIEALGLNAEAFDNDEQDLEDSRTEVSLETRAEGVPPLPEGSTLAHMLRPEKIPHMQRRGVIDWRPVRPTPVTKLSTATPQQENSSSEPKLAAPSHAELLDWNVQAPSPSVRPNEQTQSPRPAPAYAEEKRSSDVSSGEQTGPAPSQTARNVQLPAQTLQIKEPFAALEDDIATRGHQRSSTVADINYTTGEIDESNSPRPAASFRGRATWRHGVQVPRIFTGSFSQLETDIRRMQLHEVETPEEQPDLSEQHDLKVRDFAVTPQRSASPSPSPASLLFRREALLSRETELQSRLINGEVIRTRRPSTKIRAQTIDETTSGLEAWLARGDSPTLAVAHLPRPERKHTI